MFFWFYSGIFTLESFANRPQQNPTFLTVASVLTLQKNKNGDTLGLLPPAGFTLFFCIVCSGGDLAPSLGGTENFSRTKISDDLFLVIDQVFKILRFFTVLNVVYDPFFTTKTTISEKNSLIRPFFYSVRTFARIRQHYFSKCWGGPMHGPSPT